MTDKPSQNEDEYFLREEAHRLQVQAVERRQSTAEEERERLKALHYMCCPKCGLKLDSVTFRKVQIERCFNCGTTVLDAGELEALAGQEHGYLSTLLSAFKR
jgi:uncharacterized paraquat-inducible protein A